MTPSCSQIRCFKTSRVTPLCLFLFKWWQLHLKLIKEKSQGSPQWWPYKLVGWWIWADGEENSQAAWARAYFLLFFSERLLAFQSALPKNVSSLVHESQNASAGAHTKQLEWGCNKRKWWQFGPESLLFISSFTENLLSSPDLQSRQLNCLLISLFSS